jgi:hypothetical protein
MFERSINYPNGEIGQRTIQALIKERITYKYNGFGPRIPSRQADWMKCSIGEKHWSEPVWNLFSEPGMMLKSMNPEEGPFESVWGSLRHIEIDGRTIPDVARGGIRYHP